MRNFKLEHKGSSATPKIKTILIINTITPFLSFSLIFSHCSSDAICHRHDLLGIKDNLNALAMRQKSMDNVVNQGLSAIRQPLVPPLFGRFNQWGMMGGVQPQQRQQQPFMSSFPQIQPHQHIDKTTRNADDEDDDEQNGHGRDAVGDDDGGEEDDEIVSTYRRDTNCGNGCGGGGGAAYGTPIAFQPTSYGYTPVPAPAIGYDYSYANSNHAKK